MKADPQAAPATKEPSTRDRLLEVGAQAISDLSFNSCGLSEILRRAGVPKGSFYHYFDSKEDFGIALIERESAEYVERMRPLVEDHARSPLERLRAIFESGREECIRNGPARRCLIPKLALETAQLSESVHAAIKQAYERWSGQLAQIIREAQERGEIAGRHDAVHLAAVLVMLWEGATMRMQIDRSLQPLDDCLAFVFDSLLRERS